MINSSRVIALLLAVFIASVTTAFLSLLDEVTSTALIVTFLISFSVAYIMGFIILDFLIFKEIRKIYKLFEKLKKKELKTISTYKSLPFNPLKKINDEIFDYAILKQKEIDELRKLEVFRREFIADVSHELKTPIFAAQGFVHTLLDGALKDKTVRTQFLERAAKSLDDLDLLVHDLLTLSHIETGEIKMQFENFDIVGLIQEVVDQFTAKAEKKNISLTYVGVLNEKVIVNGDWKRINQVMNNLVSNAINYSNDGGSVEISLKTNKGDALVCVKDGGVGIPSEDVARIFERFFRVDKSRSRENGGTGLGLAIVKHILEEHDTKIAVKSTFGEGSEFSFKLHKAGN